MEVHKEKIRWFRCVYDNGHITAGKLYPATTVDPDGDLAVVDDNGYPYWVVITESYKHNSRFTSGDINNYFKEVTRDAD